MVAKSFLGSMSRCVAVCAVLCAGCGSSATQVLGPTDTRCGVTLTLDPATVAGGGGAGTLAVATARECPWTVTTSRDWVEFKGATSGQGPGTVTYAAAPNRSIQPRSVELAVSNQRVTLVQQAASCSISVTPGSSTIGHEGGTLGLTVSTEDFCPWTASSVPSWLGISPLNGTGEAQIAVLVAPNAGSQRVGTVDLGGAQATITQQAVPPPPAPAPPTPTPPSTPEPSPDPPAPSPVCTYGVSPLTFNNVAASGASLTIAVTTANGCAWTTSSNNGWITVVSGSTGSGPGSVTLSVAANSGTARPGTVNVAGQVVTVNQLNASQNACSFAIKPSSFNATSSGGSVDVAVSTATGCMWAVSGLPSWITAAPAGGTGSGTVKLTIQANTSGARNATVQIATQTFTVSQAAAPCTYAIAPTRVENVAAGGGSVTVAVTSASHCEWTVSGAPGWISVKPATGSGTGSVVVTAAANTGSNSRTTTFKIATQDFTIVQARPCTYSVSPNSIDVSSDSQTKTITVTTQTGCSVAAADDVSWITITSTPPAGGGSLTISIAANTTNVVRTGIVTITGQNNFTDTVDVKQDRK